MFHRVTLVAAVAVAAVACSASGSSSAARTITATLLYTGLTPVDSDQNKKASIGDVSIAPGFFVDAAGKKMGRVYASCMQVNSPGTEYNCTEYAHFQGGDILSAGRFSPLEKTSRSAIVGGTVYTGARGTFVVRWLKRDFSKAAVTFTLES
jgi:hypothetical protein